MWEISFILVYLSDANVGEMLRSFKDKTLDVEMKVRP
jgi:hypothetical protein